MKPIFRLLIVFVLMWMTAPSAMAADIPLIMKDGKIYKNTIH